MAVFVAPDRLSTGRLTIETSTRGRKLHPDQPRRPGRTSKREVAGWTASPVWLACGETTQLGSSERVAQLAMSPAARVAMRRDISPSKGKAADRERNPSPVSPALSAPECTRGVSPRDG
jgi:hypothetical protein